MKYGLIYLFFFSVTGFTQTPIQINFVWKSASSGAQEFKEAVMLIPVKFRSDTTTYFLQFDTGATRSSLYSNRIKELNSSGGKLETSIGEIRFRRDNSMEPSNDSIFSVGTLGADFLKDKIVQINYKSQVIKINHAYDPDQYSLNALSFLDGRPVVEMQINLQDQKLLYDTGSSLFGIWTTKKKWNKLRDKTDDPVSFPISSWGKINDGFYSDVDRSTTLSFGGNSLSESLKIWYVDNRNFKRFFRKNDLFGILGNQSFLTKEIVLDYQNNLFGIKVSGSSD